MAPVVQHDTHAGRLQELPGGMGPGLRGLTTGLAVVGAALAAALQFLG